MKKRNTRDIEKILSAEPEQRMEILKDIVAELRALYAGYQEKGDEIWKSCEEPREWLAGYYSDVQDALYGMQDSYESAELYWEMVALYKELFVMFFVNEEKTIIYQLAVTGEGYMLEKGSLWKNCTELSGRLMLVSRSYAEKLEDSWDAENDFTFDDTEEEIWTS